MVLVVGILAGASLAVERELAGRLDFGDLALGRDRVEVDGLAQDECRRRVGRGLQAAAGELPVAARVVALQARQVSGDLGGRDGGALQSE